ncbi:hypothetical protein MMC13_000651 [Lambiella insularis]|nr:hypothetical protein [Lambiella insularis]
MRNLACRAAYTLRKGASIFSCRVLIGRRPSHPSRTFRTSTYSYNNRSDPIEPVWNPVSDSFVTPEIEDYPTSFSDCSGDTISPNEGSREFGNGADSIDTAAEKLSKLKDRSTYGSAAKRAKRTVRRAEDEAQYPDASRFDVPKWFLERNVWLYESGRGHEERQLLSRWPSKAIQTSPTVSELDNTPAQDLEAGNDTYVIDRDVLEEICAMVGAGMRPSSVQHAGSYAASKPHLLLQCPQEGGIFFLDTVVNHVASQRAADVIRIDAQDIAEIAAEQDGDLTDLSIPSVRSLGYDTHLLMARQDDQSPDEKAGEEDSYDDAGEEVDRQGRNSAQSHIPQYRATGMPIMTFLGAVKMSDLLDSTKLMSSSVSKDDPRLPADSSQQSVSLISKRLTHANARAFVLLEAFLDAAQAKRAQSIFFAGESEKEHIGTPVPSKRIDPEESKGRAGKQAIDCGLIIHIRDYAEMNATSTGAKLLSMLHDAVAKRRKSGQRILVIGTTSSEDLIPSLSKSGFQSLQTATGQGPYRVIVTPCRSLAVASIFASDERKRNRQINTRHLQDMIRRVTSSLDNVQNIVYDSDLVIDSATVFASGLDESVWSFERVHRAATIVLGTLEEGDELTSHHITRGLAMQLSSDSAKVDWITQEKEEERSLGAYVNTSDPVFDTKKKLDERLKKLRKTCNTHEKRLLSGVIDAASINTTFADVQAPGATIDALKSLTMLSLVRPEAFTYGVLATDKIPGLLLYGPPGTGKTLLAKAVAKESGATVLEVSGSDVYDMYVGEGEKNVKAIFTLAKKLSPCVVFIDEADAIFGSRGNSGNRTSHRELINQFLREWDGMSDMSAFIMVATNRPFDLDDAVLRRLPRRLLVDLPTEKDREAILRIHLKHESLAASVTISQLASQTPYYSGSDLKNLSVAAALACVREENDAAVAHSGPEPYKHPPRRTLAPRHFDRAMEEISASISEDMSSLTAIRKFDEKFGDRKGRRKKSSGYGFGTLHEAEKNNADSVRVRAES